MTQAGEYRFALYGRSGSGKTCVLATIEMGAIGHSRGLACVGLPVQAVRPTGDPKSWTEEERVAAGLHAGADWIDAAVGKLKSREIPDANAPDGVTLAYRFTLGCPQRGQSVIHTIDYAGELLDPDGLKDPVGLAASLQHDLEIYDGFLLIAETPCPENSNIAQLNIELTRLRKSFAAIEESGAKLQTPVAVLLTKWDRYSTVDESHPENELGKAQAFLNDERHLGYKSLVNSIQNAMVNQPDINDSRTLGLTFGNCAVFPATAFGQAVRTNAQEKPAAACRPFGVLEPFVWLADRRDQLDADALDRAWISLRSQFWNPLRVGRVTREALRLSRRIPHKVDRPSVIADKVSRIRTQAASILVTVVVSWCGILGLMTASSIGFVNRREFEGQKAVIENSQASEEQLRAAQSFFNEYRLRWKGLLFAPSSTAAETMQKVIDDELDTRYWLPVTKANDDLAQAATMAKAYLDKQPNGRHVAEAHQKVEEWDATQARTANVAWLAKAHRLFDAAMKDKTIEKWKTVVDYCQSEFTHPQAATDEQNKDRHKLIDESTRALAGVIEIITWEQFAKNYREMLDRDAFKLAAELLIKSKQRDEKWQKLVREFPGEVQQRLERQVAKSLKATQFDKARSEVANAQTAAEFLEVALRPSHRELAELILSRIRKDLSPVKDRIDIEQDQALYSTVIKHRDLTACDEYLRGDRPRWMKAEVEKFRDHLRAISGPLNLTVSIFVTWDAAYDFGDHNVVAVFADGIQAFKSPAYVPAIPGKMSGAIGSFPLAKVKRETSITFKADIVEKDVVWDDDGGKGTATFKVSELLAGPKSFPLRPTDGGTLMNQLILKVTSGNPDEPSLPKWKRQ